MLDALQDTTVWLVFGGGGIAAGAAYWVLRASRLNLRLDRNARLDRSSIGNTTMSSVTIQQGVPWTALSLLGIVLALLIVFVALWGGSSSDVNAINGSTITQGDNNTTTIFREPE